MADADNLSSYVHLQRGDPAPWFVQRTSENSDFQFHTVAGRYVVLCFLGSIQNLTGRRALDAVRARRAMFDDEAMCFFGVTLDPKDERSGAARDQAPGVRFFLDFDGNVSRLYGALPQDQDVATGSARFRPFWLVLDPLLRVLTAIRFTQNGDDTKQLFEFLTQLSPPARHTGFEVQAPILVLSNVFEADLCNRLIAAYDNGVQTSTGVMHQAGSMTIPVNDVAFKVRSDHIVEDQDLIAVTRSRIKQRIIPEIVKAHQFQVTRMERFIVGCYAADKGGHFRPHRDNTTKGTAHRRFAVSINLNADFDGGEVSFPEYGPRGFKPPVGGAVVFSCGLLHAVSRITAGKRYAFLPFLYDEAAARIREQNTKFLKLRSAPTKDDNADHMIPALQ